VPEIVLVVNGPVVHVLGYGKGEMKSCYTCDSLGNRSPPRGSSPHKTAGAWWSGLWLEYI